MSMGAWAGVVALLNKKLGLNIGQDASEVEVQEVLSELQDFGEENANEDPVEDNVEDPVEEDQVVDIFSKEDRDLLYGMAETMQDLSDRLFEIERKEEPEAYDDSDLSDQVAAVRFEIGEIKSELGEMSTHLNRVIGKNTKTVKRSGMSKMQNSTEGAFARVARAQKVIVND